MVNTIYQRMRGNNHLAWLSDMVQLMVTDEIVIPKGYRQKVLAVKKLLESDSSGLVNTVLDFAIECALVDYKIESGIGGVDELLNSWLGNINESLTGKVPVGLRALAKQYFLERWKGSSLLLLRTIWEDVGGYILPTRLWFVDGEDVVVSNSNNTVRVLGDESYELLVDAEDKKTTIKLPAKNGEEIFVQKPYASWSSPMPVPFLIKRGIYRNLKMMDLLDKKGEKVVSKALEYLFLLKKGNERLTLSNNSEFIYSAEDLLKVKNDLKDFLLEKDSAKGLPIYATNFDTEIEHLIPEYSRVLSEELYIPLERKLLAGLGLIDIIQGTASSRRESFLNPKPLVSDVYSAIEDFKTLLLDIVRQIVRKNKKSHKKYFSSVEKIKVINSPVKLFLDKDIRALFRSMYDRGLLSKQTLVEIIGGVDFSVEVERRTKEARQGLNKLLYPPVILNQEGRGEDVVENPKTDAPKDKEGEGKTGVEKKNYLNSMILECQECSASLTVEAEDFEGELNCSSCGRKLAEVSVFDQATWDEEKLLIELVSSKDIVLESVSKVVLSNGIEFSKGYTTDGTLSFLAFAFDKNVWDMAEARAWLEDHVIGFLETCSVYEEAPYKRNADLPKQVKVLPQGAQTIWRKTFNSVYKDTGNEDLARKVAWKNVKLKYKKVGDKWVRKSKEEVKSSLEELSQEELVNVAKLEVLKRQKKLLDELIANKQQEEQASVKTYRQEKSFDLDEMIELKKIELLQKQNKLLEETKEKDRDNETV